MVGRAKISGVPRSTEARIEEICARIRSLCGERLSEKGEAELRVLARQLRMAIRQHVRMAKSSLEVKRSALMDRDLDLHAGQELGEAET
jgi:hypothetical protein